MTWAPRGWRDWSKRMLSCWHGRKHQTPHPTWPRSLATGLQASGSGNCVKSDRGAFGMAGGARLAGRLGKIPASGSQARGSLFSGLFRVTLNPKKALGPWAGCLESGLKPGRAVLGIGCPMGWQGAPNC